MTWKKVTKAADRLAVSHSLAISRALAKTVDPKQVAEAFLHAYPNGGTISPANARVWASTHIVSDPKPLKPVLNKLHADAYALGLDASRQAYAKVMFKKATWQDDLNSALSIDWSNWKPGNQAAALLVKPPGALRSILDAQNVVIAGMDRTTIDRIGTMLSGALAQGMAANEFSKELLGKTVENAVDRILTDPARAFMIARTEIGRAQNIAANENYKELGVEQVEWLVMEPCDECEENAEASPIGIGDSFPSGDTEPPAHPNCVCAIAPVIGGIEDQETIAETSEMDLPNTDGEVQAIQDSEMLESGFAQPVEVNDFNEKLNDTIAYAAERFPYTLEGGQSALKNYAESGHFQVNQMLRNGNISLMNTKDLSWFTRISDLDSLIASQDYSFYNDVFFRGIADPDVMQFFQRLNIGDTFQDMGFVSTTSSREIAAGFSSSFGSQRLTMVIEVPAGSQYLDVSKAMGPSYLRSAESERLLARNSRFEVVSKTDTTINVRLIND